MPSLKVCASGQRSPNTRRCLSPCKPGEKRNHTTMRCRAVRKSPAKRSPAKRSPAARSPAARKPSVPKRTLETGFSPDRPTESMELGLWKKAAEASEDAAEDYERKLREEKAANEARWAAEQEQEKDEDRQLYGEYEDERYDGGFLQPWHFRKEALSTLGLDENATVDDVKKKYRRLIKITHPDKSDYPEDYAESFRRINEAKKELIGGMYWSLKGGAWSRTMSRRRK